MKSKRRGHRRVKKNQVAGTARAVRLWIRFAALGSFAIAAIIGYVAWMSGTGDGLAPATVAPVATSAEGSVVIRVPLSNLSDGKARFFAHTSASGAQSRFFLIKTKDGKYRAALDACQACYQAHKGYLQRRDEMVCTHCKKSFPSALINEASDQCLPIGLPRAVQGDHLVIALRDLEVLDAEYASKASRSSRDMNHGR